MKELDQLVENFLQPKSKEFGLDQLVELVEQVTKEFESTLAKPEVAKAIREEKRFSMSIPISTLTPSEAWGNPDSQSRKAINKVFASISGGTDIAERINSINKFLSPASAENKRSPALILNMMMITEALQATLNDFGDSSAGFVFEGFLAALMGGYQQADKVGGTLPIEDFVAFSEFGSDVPVSLKLLSGKTPIKGSYTNLVDFLMLRGKKAIKYIVVYKQKTGKGKVEKLNFLAFDITLDNFVDFMKKVSGGPALLKPVKGTKSSDKHNRNLKFHMRAFSKDPSDENRMEAARALLNTAGYNGRMGQLDDYERGEPYEEPTGKEKEDKEAEKAEKSKKDFQRTLQGQEIDEAHRMLKEGQLTNKQAFQLLEKLHSEHEVFLMEGSGGADRQWAASISQLEGLKSDIDLTSYGILDLSQDNIDTLVKIYSKKLGAEIMKLLETTKELTESIGLYFSTDDRSGEAVRANKEAQDKSTEVKKLLTDDPLKTDEPEEIP
jgi:hypothetical protein